MTADSGRVVTVDGPVPPDALGVTFTHEHTFFDGVEAWFDRPDSAYERRLAREPLTMETLWYAHRNPLRHESNCRLDDVEEAVEELGHLARAGGGTVVDVTPKGVGSDPERVRGVARATGLQFLHGTAYYTQAAHPPGLGDRDVDDIADEFVADVREGIDDTDVRAGIVGELGAAGDVHADEERVLRAGARAAVRTGAPVSVHPPGRTPSEHRNHTRPTSRWALDILDVLEEEGLAADRVAFCHMDRTPHEFDATGLDCQRELADRGAYLEYDLWGTEWFLERYDSPWPADHERLDAVETLVEAGFADRLLFSHDVFMKIQRRRYGGFGYAHVLEHVVPALRRRGLDDLVETVLVENPRRFLTFA